MNKTKKIDRSSLVLIIIAIIGILGGIAALYSSQWIDEEELDGSAPIATITTSREDTRLKRSGNVHWYSAEKDVKCYEDDMVFTGNDSYATIEFAKGDKIQLLPNSLVSVSNGLLTLESGSIEVELAGNGASSLAVESFGKVIRLPEKSQFRIVQRDTEQNIVALKGSSPTLTKIIEKTPLKKKEFTALSPSSGQMIPKFVKTVSLKWISSEPDKNFQVTINNQTRPVQGQSLIVNTDELPSGKIQWSVANSTGETINSTFFLNEDYEIKPLYPQLNAQITMGHEETKKSFQLEWTKSLDYPQKIQISSDAAFSALLIDKEARSGVGGSFAVGQYYWRVGYIYEGEPQWSSTWSFKIEAEEKPFIQLSSIPSSLNFSLNPKYLFPVAHSLPMKDLKWQVVKGNTLIKTAKVMESQIILPIIPDGDYILSLEGTDKKGQLVKSQDYNLKVKNSKPLKAPTIHKTKVKLFVKALHIIMDSLLPSAHAEPPITIYDLKWNGPAKSVYELEIYDANQKLIERRETLTNNYGFPIIHTGTYFWKVRERVDGKWSPFSNLSEMNIEDKIVLLQSPLMKKAEVRNDKIRFTWNEPHGDFQYFLELYEQRNPTPILSLPVSGGMKVLKRKTESKKIFWRIKALSPYGNELSNQQKFLVPMDAASNKNPEENFKKSQETSVKTNQYLFRIGVSQNQNSYKMVPEDKALAQSDIDFNESLQGPSANILMEMWPGRYKNKVGFILGLRQNEFAKGPNSYSETELAGDVGYRFREYALSHHYFYLGVNIGRVAFDLGETAGEYQKGYASGRYQYQRLLGERYAFILDTYLMQNIGKNFISPSFRLFPAISYKLKESWWLSVIGGYEMTYSQPTSDQAGSDGSLDITSSIMSLGLGLTWKNF